MTEKKRKGSLVERLKDEFYHRVSIRHLPPYGLERNRFRQFLEFLPEGGLGFHSTGSHYVESIVEQGLDPKRFTDSRREEVHYYFLDPNTDPYLRRMPGEEGTVIMYHLWKNTLQTQQIYGEGKARNLIHGRATAALVVFRRASDSAFYTDIKDSTEPLFRGYNSKKRPIMASRVDLVIQTRRFISLGRTHLDFLETLPYGQANIIPPQDILKVYKNNSAKSVQEFNQQIIKDLMAQFT